jgi:hypothetical protein
MMENGSSNSANMDAEIAELLALRAIEYERQREAAATRLGLRVSVLDGVIKQRRKSGGNDTEQGKAVAADDVEPWPEPVDGAVLLDAISEAFRDHIVLTQQQADTAALWSVYSHGYDIWRISPRLGIRAAGKGCGKTELMRRIKRLVQRPLSCESLTPAVAFRLIDSAKPTLLLDEMDNLITEDRNQMLGILNSGYERSGQAFRCVGDKNEVRTFSTFCPMAYAMIGSPPGTFDSRTIVVELRRATPKEASALLSMEDGESEDRRFIVMGRKAARWVQDNHNKLATALRPDMAGLVNRTADNWRPLFAIADAVGGEWPSRVRKAARDLLDHSETHSIFEDTLNVIHEVFGAREVVKSQDLVDGLVAVEGGPWAEWGTDKKPITTNALARLLKPHKIHPRDVGPAHSRRKGYFRSQFDQAFEAYLGKPPLPPDRDHAAPHNHAESEVTGREQARTAEPSCADGNVETPQNRDDLRGCADVSDGTTDNTYDSIPEFLRRVA